MKIGVARLWHETNSFAPVPTGRAQFMPREWSRGQAARQIYQGTNTEIGGALRWAAYQGAQLVFSRLDAAMPGGPVEQAFLDEVIAEIAEDAAFEDVDGIYLSLHGACLGSADSSPETTLAVRLRQRSPDPPIASSFDMPFTSLIQFDE